MKKIVFTLITAGLLLSCNNDDNSNSDTDLIGKWQLIEVLSDPGDGSGTFSSVESDKTITFRNGGIIVSNGSLCDMGITSDRPTFGTYSSSESTFNSTDCNNSEYDFEFEKNGNILIIKYPCIEPCQAKYKRI